MLFEAQVPCDPQDGVPLLFHDLKCAGALSTGYGQLSQQLVVGAIQQQWQSFVPFVPHPDSPLSGRFLWVNPVLTKLIRSEEILWFCQHGSDCDNATRVSFLPLSSPDQQPVTGAYISARNHPNRFRDSTVVFVESVTIRIAENSPKSSWGGA